MKKSANLVTLLRSVCDGGTAAGPVRVHPELRPGHRVPRRWRPRHKELVHQI